MIATSWLIVDSHGNMRTVKNEPPQLKGDEYAFEVTLRIPERVKRRRKAINIDFPDVSPQIEDVKVLLYTDEEETPGLPAPDAPASEGLAP